MDTLATEAERQTAPSRRCRRAARARRVRASNEACREVDVTKRVATDLVRNVTREQLLDRDRASYRANSPWRVPHGSWSTRSPLHRSFSGGLGMSECAWPSAPREHESRNRCPTVAHVTGMRVRSSGDSSNGKLPALQRPFSSRASGSSSLPSPVQLEVSRDRYGGVPIVQKRSDLHAVDSLFLLASDPPRGFPFSEKTSFSNCLVLIWRAPSWTADMTAPHPARQPPHEKHEAIHKVGRNEDRRTELPLNIQRSLRMSMTQSRSRNGRLICIAEPNANPAEKEPPCSVSGTPPSNPSSTSRPVQHIVIALSIASAFRCYQNTYRCSLSNVP